MGIGRCNRIDCFCEVGLLLSAFFILLQNHSISLIQTFKQMPIFRTYPDIQTTMESLAIHPTLDPLTNSENTLPQTRKSVCQRPSTNNLIRQQEDLENIAANVHPLRWRVLLVLWLGKGKQQSKNIKTLMGGKLWRVIELPLITKGNSLYAHYLT